MLILLRYSLSRKLFSDVCSGSTKNMPVKKNEHTETKTDRQQLRKQEAQDDARDCCDSFFGFFALVLCCGCFAECCDDCCNQITQS